jgi:hypothetical protein
MAPAFELDSESQGNMGSVEIGGATLMSRRHRRARQCGAASDGAENRSAADKSATRGGREAGGRHCRVPRRSAGDGGASGAAVRLGRRRQRFVVGRRQRRARHTHACHAGPPSRCRLSFRLLEHRMVGATLLFLLCFYKSNARHTRF